MGGRAEGETRKATDGFGRYFWLSDERGFRDVKKPVNKGLFKIKMHKGEKENGIVR